MNKQIKKVKDDGQRTIFDTGSQKEIIEGRGRYDLMPLHVIAELHNEERMYEETVMEDYEMFSDYIYTIHKAMVAKEVQDKQECLLEAAIILIKEVLKINVVQAVQQLSVLYELGAAKYAARDWEKGRPMEVFLNSALRHTYQYLNNEEDENHGIQALWNIVSCIDTIRRLPACAYTLTEEKDE